MLALRAKLQLFFDAWRLWLDCFRLLAYGYNLLPTDMAVLHFSSAEELVHQLLPSHWSKRMDADSVIRDHLTKTETGNWL